MEGGAVAKRKITPAENNRPAQQAKARADRIEKNLTWAKDALRPALSRWIRERTDDAAIELAVVADMVVGLPRTAKLNDPIVRMEREKHAAEKRTWLTYHRAPLDADEGEAGAGGSSLGAGGQG